MAYENIRFEITGGIARLTLARPRALDALNRALLAEVIDALDMVRDADEVRALLIVGEGRGFSSGADLSSGGSPAGSDGLDGGAVLEAYYNPLIERLRRFQRRPRGFSRKARASVHRALTPQFRSEQRLPMSNNGGPLAGVKVLEFAGLGPGPFAGTMLPDMGANIVRIGRKGTPDPTPAPIERDATSVLASCGIDANAD